MAEFIVSQENRIIAFICYILTWVGGVILLIMAKDDKTMKFYAWQAIVLGLIASVLMFVCIGFLVWLYMIYGGYLIYTGKEFRAPYVGDFVEKTFVK
jgi:uncharacterized membrane protein